LRSPYNAIFVETFTLSLEQSLRVLNEIDLKPATNDSNQICQEGFNLVISMPVTFVAILIVSFDSA